MLSGFTGDVYIDAIKLPDNASSVAALHVRFAPGARTFWHSHPHGQTLYVTDGVGLVASKDGEVKVIRPGDVVHIAPNEVHWHGATADRLMAHIAIHEADARGEMVTWLDPVNDETYVAANSDDA